MPLANYIVSHSLEINSRCLRYLAECDVRGDAVPGADTPEGLDAEAHTVYAESLLARDSRRLSSLQDLMVGARRFEGEEEAVYVAHVRTLRETAHTLSDAASPRRLAMRLAAIAPADEEAQAMLTVARRLEADNSLGWDALNTVFTQDSRYWRSTDAFQEISDERLIHRIARSYRKAYDHSADFFALLQSQDDSRALAKRQAKLGKWSQLAAHQLELLRPQLSEKGKAQAWYLDKLADTLRMRMGLEALGDAVRGERVNEDVAKSDVKLARKYVTQQLNKMDQRLSRLAQSCFTTRPKKMRRRLAEAENRRAALREQVDDRGSELDQLGRRIGEVEADAEEAGAEAAKAIETAEPPMLMPLEVHPRTSLTVVEQLRPRCFC